MTAPEVQDQTVQKILALCDVTEKMVMAIEDPKVKNKQELLEIVTPVAHRVNEAVQIVTQTFIEHVKNEEKPDKERSQKIDMAMKAIYDALYAMKEKGEEIAERLQKEPQNG